MVKPEDFATVVLPAETRFVLPRNLAQKIVQLGQKLLVFDPVRGQWALNQPAASQIALVLFDDDELAASAWTNELERDYNKYVKDAVEKGDELAIIP
jgi:hypothetical protein